MPLVGFDDVIIVVEYILGVMVIIFDVRFVVVAVDLKEVVLTILSVVVFYCS